MKNMLLAALSLGAAIAALILVMEKNQKNKHTGFQIIEEESGGFPLQQGAHKQIAAPIENWKNN